MKLLDRRAESCGIAANLVERCERHVPVEARVFDALGLNGHGELLKLHRELPPDPHLLVLLVPLGEQHAAQEQEQRARHHRVTAARPIDGEVNPFAVHGGKAGRADVGAIDGKAGHHFDNRLAQGREREVAGAPIAHGNRSQCARQHGELAGHRASHDQALAVIGNLGERFAPPADPGP